MVAFIDINGRTFGRWTAMRRAPNMDGEVAWRCRCACGKFSNVRGVPLRSGASLSCGCLAQELSSVRNRTHGWKGTSTYKAWCGMHERCRMRSRKDWAQYGGRGITCCKRWDSFVNFLADMGPRPERMTLERENVNGNYEPGNCCWATAKTQANNRTNNRMVDAFGETKNAKQWSEDTRCAVSYNSLLSRLIAGWEPARAITCIRGSRWSKGSI